MFTPEQIAEARYLYEQTLVPITDIGALLGVSERTLRNRVKEFGWHKRNPHGRSFSPELLLRRKAEATAKTKRIGGAQPEPGDAVRPNSDADDRLYGPRAPADRLEMAERLQRMAERELELIDGILATMPTVPDEGEREKSVRTLASLGRTLREMVRLMTPPSQPEPDDDDDTVPCDLDELRRALCEKLERIVAGSSGDPSGGT
jgi:hypothetical protein